MAKEVKTGEFGVLEVLNDEGSSKKVHSLKPGSFAIGSSLNAKIRLNNKKVQDLHCIVNVLENGVASLTAQSIFNPTKLNNNVMRKDTNTLLNPGDIFVIGDVKILYKNNSLTQQEVEQKGKSIKPKIFGTPRRGSTLLRHVTQQEHQQKSKSVVKPKIFNTPRRESAITHAREQILQQKSKSVVKAKIFSTPRRGSPLIKHVSMTNSAKKKCNFPVSRLISAQRRPSSGSLMGKNSPNNWAAEPLPESLIPSLRNIGCDPVERDAVVVDSPSHRSSIRRTLSKSGSTTNLRGIKEVLSLSSTDSSDSEEPPTESVRLMKPNLIQVASFDMLVSETHKISPDKLPERMHTEEALDLPTSSKEMPKNILHFSTCNQYLVLGEPTKLKRTKSVSDVTTPVFNTKSDKINVRNKSFTAVSNEKTSDQNKSSKLNRIDKSIEKASPSPAFVTSRSRNLSITTANNTLEESLAEDIEQAYASTSSIKTRRSRQSQCKNYNDTEPTIENIVARRSRSLIPAMRQSENDTLSKSFAAFENTQTPKATATFNNTTSTQRKSSKYNKFNKSIEETSPSPAFGTSRSRNLSTASITTANNTMEESLAEDIEQAYASTSNIKSHQSECRNYNDTEPTIENIVARRSRSLTPAMRQSGNGTLSKSFAAFKNTQTPKATATFKSPTSIQRKSLKFNKFDKSIEKASPSPACGTSKSRNLSTTTADNTLEESLAEDIEPAYASTSSIETRRSRQSQCKNYNDAEPTIENIVARRSRSVTPAMRQSENDTLSKSFATFENTQTPKATATFKNTTSTQKKSTKYNKFNKSIEETSPSPAFVTSRSRNLSTASITTANNTMEESLAENIEQAYASTSSIKTRRSRQSQCKNYNDTEPTIENIVARRSRSLNPAMRQSENGTLSKSFAAFENTQTPKATATFNNTTSTQRKSSKYNKFNKSIEETSPSPAFVTSRSRNLSNASITTANNTMEESLAENIEQAYAFPSNIKSCRSEYRNFNDTEPTIENIVARRSRSLTPAMRQSGNDTLSKSFATFRNTQTSKVTATFKSRTSIQRKSLKFNKFDKSVEKASPSAAFVTSRSRNLSTASTTTANNTLEESLAEDIEQAYASTSSIETRRSRQSKYKKYSDTEPTVENIVARRSRSLTPAMRESENDTPNKSGMTVILSPTSVSENRISRRSLSVGLRQHENHRNNLKHGASMGNIKEAASSPVASSFQRSRSMFTTKRQSRNEFNGSIKDNQQVSSNIAGRRPSLLLPKQFENDMSPPLSPNIPGRRSRRSLFKHRLSMGNVERKVPTPISSSSSIETRSSKNLSRQSGNSTLKTFSSTAVVTVTDKDQSIETILNSSSEDSGAWESYSRGPHDNSSTTLDLTGSTSSSYVETTVSSSFVYENSPSSSFQLMVPVSNVSGVEKLTKTPKQTVQARTSRSSIKSGRGRGSVYADEDNVSPLINFSSTLSDDTFVDENTEDDLEVVEQTLTVKTQKHDVSARKIVKTPKIQKSPHNDLSDVIGTSRSSIKSGRGRGSVYADEDNVSPLINFSSTLNDDTFADENTEDDLEVVEQTLTVKTPKHDVSARKIVKTPKIQKSPHNDLSDVIGVKRVMATPKPVKSPKNDISDVRGIKKLMKTPKAQKAPKNDLTNPPGFKQLFEIPKSPKNDLNDVRGVKRLLATPAIQRSPENDLRDVRGVKKVMKTPKIVNPSKNDLSNLPGFKQLFEIPKSPKNDLRDVKGVKGILKTPKARNSPRNDLRNPPEFKKLFDLPTSSRNSLDDFEGVETLMKTPVVIKSSKNDLTDVRGVKQILKTPRLPKSPKNDLREPYGVKRLMATPKPMKSPKNDLNDVSGVDILMKTPNVLNSSKRSMKKVGSGVLSNILNQIQITKIDRKRQKVLSLKQTRERAPKSDYTDVRGVKRMFAEEEAAYKNTSNISGVADLFNVSSTPTSSETFTALFNKKPLRTYQSKSPSPNKLKQLRIERTSSDASPAESSVTSDVVNWVNTVNQQFVINAHDSVSQSSPNKDVELKTPVVILKRSKRLASRTPTPSKNVDSPSTSLRLRSVKEKRIAITPLLNKADPAMNEAENVAHVKKIKMGILKETVNSNVNSAVTAPKRTRRNKNLGVTTKENLTPEQSDTASDTQCKTVTFNIEESEETRRSKRTPKKPAKFNSFVSALRSKNAKNKEGREENQQQPLLSDEEEEPLKRIKRKRGAKIAVTETNETSEEPTIKTSGKKQANVIVEVDRLEKEKSQTIVENGEDEKPAKRRRGRQVDENEKIRVVVESIEDRKPAKRLRGKQNIVDEKVDEKLEKEKSKTVTKNDERGKNLPTRGQKRKIVEKVDQSDASEVNSMKDPAEVQPAKRRARKAPMNENTEDSENESEVSTTKDAVQKPAKRRGRKRISEEVGQAEMKQLDLNIADTVEVTTVQKRGRKNVNNVKIDQLEDENKKSVKTRGQKQEIVTQNHDESETKKKSVTTRGRKQETVDEEPEAKEKPLTRRGRKQLVNTKIEQLEADLEVVVDKVKLNKKSIAAKRGRKPAAKLQISNEEESDKTSETVDDADTVPLRRTTRRGVAKQVSSPDVESSVSSNNPQQKGKRGRKEVVEELPIRKSARTRR